MYFFKNLKASFKEIKNVSSLTGSSIFTALNIIIHQFFTVFITNTLHVSFTFISVALCGMMYGPFVGGLSAVAADLIKYAIKHDGAFFIGFTFNEFLLGFIYGLFLYKKRVTLLRVFFAQLFATVIVNLGLTSMWLSIMYGKSFMILLSARIVKNLIMLPIGTVVIFLLARSIEKYINVRNQ